MNLIDQPAAPGPAPVPGATDSVRPAPTPPDQQLRINGEQADRLLRSARWQQ